MVQKRIFYAFLILIFLGGCVTSPQIPPTLYPKERKRAVTYSDGSKYVGEFRDGKRHGQGTYTFPSGNKYVGEFRDGKHTGQGTFTWPNGQKYVGEFKDGKGNGQGTMTWPNGNKYVGEFKDGKQNGQGALTLPDGRKYVGEFKDDKYIGHGTPSVTKAINVAKNYGQNDILKNKMMVSSQRWAVIIGLSNYKDTRIPPLRYASKDAKSFYDWAISPNGGKYPPSQVKLLMDNEATGRKIKNALYIWLKQALEEDVVAIYFAGHGSPESPDSPDNLYLLPYDTDYQNIASTGFPMWDIKTALKRFIKAKKVVVIADACHAGGVGQSFDVAIRANRAIAVNPISSGLQNLSQIGDGICVISASDDKQFSQESKDWGGRTWCLYLFFT